MKVYYNIILRLLVDCIFQYFYLVNSKIEDEKEINQVFYKIKKKDVKKMVMDVRNKVFENVYENLDNKEGEKLLFRQIQVRERNVRDLD